jgi:DNA topoisomerase-1
MKVALKRALELLSKKENRNQPLRSLGPHPETGESVDIYEGRYGPYVKHQRTNASLPKGGDPATLTMEEALALLAAKAKKGGGRSGGRRRTAKK